MDSQDIISFATLVVGIIGFVYGYIKDKENKKLNNRIRETDERIKANEMYDKIRNKREIFEDYMTDLLCIDKSQNINSRKNTFMKSSQKYNALYNEIEDFCTKLFDGAIKSETYIIETILPILSDLAEQQVEYYSSLNKYAEKYSFEKLRKPDFKAFEKYDEFLIKYNGGDSGHFWRKIKNMRRDADFE